ncbi:hypothetical protein V6N13_014801 [Hibiscus sabdariffa]|uniref:Uncharacterized protein n=1 Tax=Hibiscus sabdariffa TaxID=183260 RepID=A0ABR2RWG5_9ROSI
MPAAKQLTGDEFVLVDSTTLMTEMLSDSKRADLCLSFMYQDMVVGLGITWCPSKSDDALLVICTRVGCVLTSVRSGRDFWTRQQFLVNKDIIFVGVRMISSTTALCSRCENIGIRGSFFAIQVEVFKRRHS